MISVQTHRIAFADALRTFAIFSVVVCHIVAILPHTSDSFAAEIENVGGWGVGCFFVLTGFLLGRPYLQAILDPAQQLFPSTLLFLTRRFYRIFPLYAFAVLVTAIGGLIHKHHGVTLANVAIHLAFLHGFFPAYDGAPFGPLWTMAVDAQFYLVLPLIALMLYRILRGRPPAARISGIIATLTSAIVVSIVWRYVVATHETVVFTDFNTSLVYVRNLVGMGGSFALGIALALFGVLEPRPPQRVCVIAVALGVTFVGAFCLLSVRGGLTSMVLGDLVAGASAVLILGGLIEGRFSALTRIARSPATTALAALSYAVYLFHKPVIVGVHDFLVAHGHAKSVVDIGILIVVSAALLAAIAILTHRFVEKPFLNLRDCKREAPRVVAQQASAFDSRAPGLLVSPTANLRSEADDSYTTMPCVREDQGLSNESSVGTEPSRR